MTALDKATALGHAMRPSRRPLAPGVVRHECARCLAASVDFDGNSYGLATEISCADAVRPGAA